MLSGITEKSWEESCSNSKSPDSYMDRNIKSIEQSDLKRLSCLSPDELSSIKWYES